MLLNAKIDEALVSLRATRSWINSPVQDKRTDENIKN